MLDREEFSELVCSAVKHLPRAFRRQMQNISIEIEDCPDPELARRVGADRRTLLGLYQGTPLNRRSVWQNRPGPDRIIIYQANVEAQAGSSAGIRELVREVVMHEIGHYFGLNEEELRAAQPER